MQAAALGERVRVLVVDCFDALCDWSCRVLVRRAVSPTRMRWRVFGVSATSNDEPSDCTPADAGYYASTGSQQQTPCLPGSITSHPGQEKCVLCLAGEFQSRPGQTACESCTRGFYCEAGTARPTPCPAGTSSNAMGAVNRDSCTPVLAGFWAPLGSSLPEVCPPTGFYCPGAALDTVHHPPGSLPVLVPTGGATKTETVLAPHTLRFNHV